VRKQVKGAIHVMMRMFPILFEDKDLLMRSMWREQPLFSNQLNAVLMMDAISILLFKPGFTIQELPEGTEVQTQAIDENCVWKSGISVLEASNHYNNSYN